MKNIYTFLIAISMIVSIVGCSSPSRTLSQSKAIEDVQIYSTNNTNKKVTLKTIENAFESVGLSVPGNNDMNKPFSKRFGKVHYQVYNLAMYINNDLTFKLIKKYPQFGALTPLTMSIWSDGETMNISTLTINGMSRATQVPLNDPNLIAYATLIHKALKKAMPNGHFKDLPFAPTHKGNSYQINFSTDVTLDEGTTVDDFIDDFEAEFEGELEPLGFLLPNYTNLQEEIFDDHNYHAYDFYHTYSICKFDVIYPVSKLHPEAGAWAPCSFYLYKKKGEKKMHMGFLGVDNWISTLDIKDEKSIKPLKEAQGMIVNIIKEMTNE